MSISSNVVRKNIKLAFEENNETEKAFPKKMKKQISLQNDNFQKEIYKKLNEGSVLHFIRNSDRKESNKTFSDSNGEVKYDLCMINKFDENLNSSLSFISEFDLEEDENEKENSFDSSDNDDSVEQIEIFEKNKKKSILDKDDDEEHNTKLEKEWNEVQKLLLHKNSP
jgi:hypothetical protein